MKGYKIDFTASTITITADFAKKMNDPTSAEYKTISQIKKDFPQMKIINKTHKTPRKYVSKSTGETFNCNQFKNLKYENMEGFINGLSNSEDYMMLASGVPSHILSGITDHFLSENWEPINEFLDCQQPRLANCLFLCCHRLNSLNLASLH